MRLPRDYGDFRDRYQSGRSCRPTASALCPTPDIAKVCACTLVQVARRLCLPPSGGGERAFEAEDNKQEPGINAPLDAYLVVNGPADL